MVERDLTRRYVYDETYDEVMLFAKDNCLKSPNGKNNFPFYLESYLKAIKSDLVRGWNFKKGEFKDE